MRKIEFIIFILRLDSAIKMIFQPIMHSVKKITIISIYLKSRNSYSHSLLTYHILE